MKPSLTALLAVFAAACLALPSLTAPQVLVLDDPAGFRLMVDGKLITLFRTSNGALSAEERADRAADRLRDLIEKGLTGADITTKARPDGSWGVYAADSLVMIATDAEAKLRKETPAVTAKRWAANLKAAIGTETDKPRLIAAKPKSKPVAKPQPTEPAADPSGTLAPRSTDVAVPLGETRSVMLRGTAKGAATARVEGAAATAQVSASGDSVEVRGVAIGKAIIRVGRGGLETAFTVWEKKWAGQVAETPAAMVTGTLTPAEYVKKVAVAHALEGVRREPGATVKITGPATGVKQLERGESTLVRFPITIDGPNLLARETFAQVKVDNLTLDPEPAKVLLYSNDPESIREYGTLYEGMVDDDGPARLMYHHQNRMGRAFTFEVHLLNPNRTPVDVQIIEGEAGPVLDTIQVGHRAAQRYLEASTRDVGYIITIPPRKSRTIVSANVPQLLTVSGIYGLRILDGGPLIAHVSASPEPSLPAVTNDLVAAARAEPDTFPTPQKNESYKYAVGGVWTFIPLGRKPIVGKTPTRKLFGNYGVIYNLTVDLQNPTDEEKTVTVRLAAEAGWTRGVFLIDGKMVEAPQIAPPGEAVLWSVKLSPQENRQVRIQGIPVGGSAYPVSLVVRS